jgi:hypothetical protein
MCNGFSTAVQPVDANQAKAVATPACDRSSVMPNLATAHEQWLADFDAYAWNAVFLPKETPAGLVGRLNAAFRSDECRHLRRRISEQQVRMMGLCAPAGELTMTSPGATTLEKAGPSNSMRSFDGLNLGLFFAFEYTLKRDIERVAPIWLFQYFPLLILI